MRSGVGVSRSWEVEFRNGDRLTEGRRRGTNILPAFCTEATAGFLASWKEDMLHVVGRLQQGVEPDALRLGHQEDIRPIYGTSERKGAAANEKN